jgi:hypothetical protein
MAGLGVFILNFQVQPIQAIYVQAKLEATTSVIMAEAASLALASAIIAQLNLTAINYLSDCEQLVHFLNSEDLSNPPRLENEDIHTTLQQPINRQVYQDLQGPQAP